MTKDRPRNRPGNGGKSGGSGGSRGGGPDGRRSGGTARPDQRNEQHGRKSRLGGRGDRREPAFEENGEVWIWGIHAAAAVLANPMRKTSTALMTRNAAERLGLDAEVLPRFAHIIEARELDDRLPPGAVHQGVAVRCRPLDGIGIEDAVVRPGKPLAILDQVTDPQNVGAIFRSAAAFGVQGIVMQTRNAPTAGGALAKAAAGSIEQVEEIRSVNISRAIDALRDAGWTVIGLDGSATQTLEQAVAVDGPVAIVLGAEGDGIRQGVANACSGLARIPMQPGMESLNVSNAAAIAFYELSRKSPIMPAPAAVRARRPDDAEPSGFDGADE